MSRYLLRCPFCGGRVAGPFPIVSLSLFIPVRTYPCHHARSPRSIGYGGAASLRFVFCKGADFSSVFSAVVAGFVREPRRPSESPP